MYSKKSIIDTKKVVTMYEETMYGERIRELRLKNGWTQDKFSEHVNLKKSTISDIENNKKSPGRKAIDRMADLFGVTTDYLMGKSDDPELNEELFSEFKKVMDRLDKLSPDQQQLVLQNMQDMTKRLEEMNIQKK